MKNKWIIEKHMFPEYEEKILSIIGKDNYLLFDDTNYKFNFNKDIKNKFNNDDCLIFHGSFQRGRQILRETNFIPGIFLTVDNYECYKYYGYYNENLVNSDYIFIGLNALLNKNAVDNIFKHFNSNEIFIRPSNGYKTFTGQLISKENWDLNFKIFLKSYGGVDIDQLVLISSPKIIKEENRFIIYQDEKNHIIDGNVYMINGELIKERIFDIDAYKYCKTICDLYAPDKIFTMDIAKMFDNSYKILEIGTFCCAGLYNMDFEKVVNDVNEICLKYYNEYQKII